MIKIKKLNISQKKNKAGGSFYAIALGVGILVSTLSNVVMSAINMSKPNAEQNTANYGYKKTTVMRLSPVPSRSSFSIIG